jgi:ferredoxin
MAKISIDKDKCIGCGACVSIDSDTFEMKDGKADLKNKKATESKDAIESCPVSAITIMKGGKE